MMEVLGQIEDCRVCYLNINKERNWSDCLSGQLWAVFTISDEDGIEVLQPVIQICLDKKAVYICSAGRNGDLTEQLFDECIVDRGIEEEVITGLEFDYKQSPITTSHTNFNEGFWYAATIASFQFDDPFDLICIDFTQLGVKKHLKSLIAAINSDENWQPSEVEFEDPKYDSKL
ncbi:MAG: hypothetical protein ACKOW2_03585 [Sphingobacteriaceae bacterium]